jgi:hypothetical protein
MEKVRWTDRVINGAVLHKVKEERNIIHNNNNNNNNNNIKKEATPYN